MSHILSIVAYGEQLAAPCDSIDAVIFNGPKIVDHFSCTLSGEKLEKLFWRWWQGHYAQVSLVVTDDQDLYIVRELFVRMINKDPKQIRHTIYSIAVNCRQHAFHHEHLFECVTTQLRCSVDNYHRCVRNGRLFLDF